MRWKIIAPGSFLHSRALACSPRFTAFYKGHGRSESLRQFGRPSPYIDGESGCLIQTDPPPIGDIAVAIGRQIQSNRRRPLYRTYADARASLSNSYAPTRTLALSTMEDLGCFKRSHTLLPARLRRRVRLRSMPGGAQRRIKRGTIGPKLIICAVPVRNGGRSTRKSPQGPT